MGASGKWISTSLIGLKKTQTPPDHPAAVIKLHLLFIYLIFICLNYHQPVLFSDFFFLNLQEKLGTGKSRKWKLWRSSSSGGFTTSSKGTTKVAGRLSDSSYMAAMATVLRAPARDFMVVRQEWAAIRIQTVFRAFLVIKSGFSTIYLFPIYCF